MKKSAIILAICLSLALCLTGCITVGGGEHVHSYGVDYKCECGSTVTPSTGLRLELSTDETYYAVEGIGDCKDTTVVIPATHEGKPVTKIGSQAFAQLNNDNKTKVEKIIMTNSITVVEERAFSECSSFITEVVLSDNITHIGDFAFSACGGLSGKLPSKVEHIGAYAFERADIGAPITIPGTVRNVSEMAFANARYTMTGVVMEEGVESIGKNAFYYASSVTSVTIPKSVHFIGIDAFAECRDLTEVNYNGTIAEWSAIQNDCAGEWTVRCTDGETAW